MATRKTEEPEDLEEQLEELERKVERLRVIFEQYFLGIEKRPPLTLQKDVVRLLRQVATYHIRKTSLKFRLQSLSQRFNVHRAYWNRTMREIEDGTYRRDRSRAERREVARTGERVDAAELAKRTLLRDLKGDEAVEARRERLAANGETEAGPTPYVPAVARRRNRRERRSAAEIRGAPAEQVAQQVSDRKDSTEALEALAELALGSRTASERPKPTLRPAARTRDADLDDSRPAQPAAAAATPTPPRPTLRPAAAGLGTPDSVLGSTERARPAPTLARRPNAPGKPTPNPSPAPAVSSTAATEVLRNAGLPPERAHRIYSDWVAARQRAGQPTQGVSYERLVESMARQVPKLRETHGALRVDFEVVTKDDKVFLKPRTR